MEQITIDMPFSQHKTKELFLEVFESLDGDNFDYLREIPCTPGSGGNYGVTDIDVKISYYYKIALSLSSIALDTSEFGHVFASRCPHQFIGDEGYVDKMKDAKLIKFDQRNPANNVFPIAGFPTGNCASE